MAGVKRSHLHWIEEGSSKGRAIANQHVASSKPMVNDQHVSSSNAIQVDL
jgi:hypothetical protein